MLGRTLELVALLAVVLYAKHRGTLGASRRDWWQAIVLLALWALFVWVRSHAW